MNIQKVLVYQYYDIDYEHKTLFGLSASLLNAVDRIEFECGDKRIKLPSTMFSKEDWFDNFLELIK